MKIIDRTDKTVVTKKIEEILKDHFGDDRSHDDIAREIYSEIKDYFVK